MALNAINKERLYAQAKKMDRLTKVYFNQFLPNYIDTLEKALPSILRVNALFDETSTKIKTDKPEIPHGEEYISQSSKNLYGSGCNIKSTEVAPGVFSVEIDKPLGDGKEDTEIFFDQITKPRALQFSKGLSLIPLDERGEPVYNLAIFLGEQNYLQFLPKIPGPTPFFTPKTQYRGKTTFEMIHYFGVEEKELLKKQLYEIIGNYGVRLAIFAECENREIAYEKLVLPGKEEHQRWRVRVEGYDWIKPEINSPADLDRMIFLDDLLGIYPKLKQQIETDEGILELQTRLILEIDPRSSDLEYTGFVFDKMTKAIKDLGLPFRRFHSGSLSPRVHIEIETEDILENAFDICENFSFLGAGVNKPISTIKDAYNAIISGVTDSIFLYTWNKSKFYKLPKITKNKFSTERDFCLFDRPTNVSIAGGSPKKIVRLNRKTREILEKVDVDEKYKKIPVTVSMCTPLLDNEPTPKTPEKILELCNPLFAIDRLNAMYLTLERKMSEKITSEHVKQIFDKTPRKQFKNLHEMDERNFRAKYSNP